MEFEHQELENLLCTMDNVSNRIVTSMIVTALIIGSSLIMLTEKGVTFMDYPILGIIGFLIAGVLRLWLIITMLFSKKL